MWRMIYCANQDRLGENTALFVPGLANKMPCIGPQGRPVIPAAADTAPPHGPATGQAPIRLSSILIRIEFLTTEDAPPATGRMLEEGPAMKAAGRRSGMDKRGRPQAD